VAWRALSDGTPSTIAAGPTSGSSSTPSTTRRQPANTSQAIALVGHLGTDLGDGLVGDLGTGAGGYRAVFGTSSTASLPVYSVPGSGDAPADLYLRESYTVEVAFPLLRGVHGTAALAPDAGVVFAGTGASSAMISTHLARSPKRLRYPRWEPAYRLKLLAPAWSSAESTASRSWTRASWWLQALCKTVSMRWWICANEPPSSASCRTSLPPRDRAYALSL
jgi:Metallophosphoesterase, calcineurin superfamily